MRKKILIGLGIVVVLIIILMATGALKFSVRVTPSKTAEEGGSQSTLPDGWEKYGNTEVGYSIGYPKEWKLQEDAQKGSGEVLIVASEGNAFIRIAAFQDSAISSEEKIRASMKEYEASFSEKPNEALLKFESDVINGIGYFRVNGNMKVGDVPYGFLERGMLAPNGNVLIMRGAATAASVEVMGPIVNQIMESFSLIELQ